jgi:hypothetical protein
MYDRSVNGLDAATDITSVLQSVISALDEQIKKLNELVPFTNKSF